MEKLDFALRVLGLLFSLPAVGLGFVKLRRMWIERGMQLLPDGQADTIYQLNARMRLLELASEHKHRTLEECERERDAAHKALELWDKLLGSTWIQGALDAAETANGGD